MNAYQNGKTRIFEVAQSARASTVAGVTLAGVYRDVNLRYARVNVASQQLVWPSSGFATVLITDGLSSRTAAQAPTFHVSALGPAEEPNGARIGSTSPTILRSRTVPLDRQNRRADRDGVRDAGTDRQRGHIPKWRDNGVIISSWDESCLQSGRTLGEVQAIPSTLQGGRTRSCCKNPTAIPWPVGRP